MGKKYLSVRICESQSRPFRNFLSGDITDVPPTIGLLSNLFHLYGPSFSLLYLEQKLTHASRCFIETCIIILG